MPTDSVSDFAGFHGPIRSREADSVATVPDGASNVAMFGESLGDIGPAVERGHHSLIGGLSFGNASIYDGLDTLFGDARMASVFQFSGFHAEVVNFARCDGSTVSVCRDVDGVMFERFCGAADGNTFRLFDLGDINQDKEVDLLDVQPFVGLVTDQGFLGEGDINGDGVVDLADIEPFVDLLLD